MLAIRETRALGMYMVRHDFKPNADQVAAVTIYGGRPANFLPRMWL